MTFFCFEVHVGSLYMFINICSLFSSNIILIKIDENLHVFAQPAQRNFSPKNVAKPLMRMYHRHGGVNWNTNLNFPEYASISLYWYIIRTTWQELSEGEDFDDTVAYVILKHAFSW